MTPTIGCIGCGNMGQALLLGLSRSFSENGINLCCFDVSAEKMTSLQQAGVSALKSGSEVAQKASIIILAVKPVNLASVLDEIAPVMTGEKIVISLAAGYGLTRLRNHLGQQPGVGRVMPTTTAKVGKGVFAICFDPLTDNEQQKKTVTEIFSSLGICLELNEDLFPAYSALIGAGPAYIFEMLSAMSQAGLTLGFSAAQSREMLLELCAGCAELANQNDTSFMNLRDMVCSPAGLTIAGINKLDKAGFVGHVVEAVEAAHKRAQEMENQ